MANQQPTQPRTRRVPRDPRAQAIARVYAEAFLGAVQSSGADAALEEFASLLDDVLQTNPQFERLLYAGVIGRDEKVKLIERVLAPQASPLFTNFLKVLAHHDRLSLLPLIYEEAQLMHEKAQGKGRVRVTSARPLSEAQQEHIRGRLQAALPFDPIIENHVDASLLGGLLIQVGDTIHDSSLRTRLKQLRLRLRQRSLHEIQSGRDRFSSPEGN